MVVLPSICILSTAKDFRWHSGGNCMYISGSPYIGFGAGLLLRENYTLFLYISLVSLSV